MWRLSIDIADWNFVPFVRLLFMTERLSDCATSLGVPLKTPLSRSIALERAVTFWTHFSGVFLVGAFRLTDFLVVPFFALRLVVVVVPFFFVLLLAIRAAVAERVPTSSGPRPRAACAFARHPIDSRR